MSPQEKKILDEICGEQEGARIFNSDADLTNEYLGIPISSILKTLLSVQEFNEIISSVIFSEIKLNWQSLSYFTIARNRSNVHTS